MPRGAKPGNVLRQVAVCDSKNRYTTEAAARVAAEKNRRTWGGPRLHPYQCPMCGGWHLSKKVPKKSVTVHNDPRP
jgi:hypothetical protein